MPADFPLVVVCVVFAAWGGWVAHSLFGRAA